MNPNSSNLNQLKQPKQIDPLLLSIVIPCFNEEEVLNETNKRLDSVLEELSQFKYEFVYVDDGSIDSTPEILHKLQTTYDYVRVIRLSRNYGHQIATTAGLEYSSGSAVVLIDADLQDPPEVIVEMVEKWEEGWDVVYGTRVDREGETGFKLWTAKMFYKLMNQLSDVKIPLDTGDFRLMDRKVVDALLNMPERDRFIRGMVSWVGFKQTSVSYHRMPRTAGTSKYPLHKMIHFAVDGILSFSRAPLKLATLLGFITSGLAILGITYALILRVFTNIWVTGWTLLFITVLFIGGVQLISLGLIGEYIGRIYGEVKKRPLYLVEQKLGFRESINKFPKVGHE